jgi:hypothetical protein
MKKEWFFFKKRISNFIHGYLGILIYKIFPPRPKIRILGMDKAIGKDCSCKVYGYMDQDGIFKVERVERL